MAANTTQKIPFVHVNGFEVKQGDKVTLQYSEKGRIGVVDSVTPNNVLVELPNGGGFRNFSVHKIELENKGDIVS